MGQFIGGHDACLHFGANDASREFAQECNLDLHRNAYNAAMTAEQEERNRLSAALVAFYEANEKAGLKSVRHWAIAAGLSASTINPVLNGTKNKRISDETYFKLSVGASELLSRFVSVEELKGEPERQPAELSPQDKQDLILLQSLKPKVRQKYRELLQAMAADEDEPESGEGAS